MSKKEITPEMVNARVVKANVLIQQSRFSLSTQQQKIVLFLISQVNPFDDDFKEYEFSIQDFCRLCGIDETNGYHYIEIKKAIKDIADKSMWIEISEDEETLCRWIEKPYLNKNNGKIRIRLDKDMKPYLLKIKDNFTQYELLYTLRFKSKYTIRLYELIKSIHFDELHTYTREYSLEELKKRLDCEKYEIWQSLKARVLDTAIAEINEYSDKIVTYEKIKKGRAVSRVRFTITTKEPAERFEINCKIKEELGLNQLSFWGEQE